MRTADGASHGSAAAGSCSHAVGTHGMYDMVARKRAERRCGDSSADAAASVCARSDTNGCSALALVVIFQDRELPHRGEELRPTRLVHRPVRSLAPRESPVMGVAVRCEREVAAHGDGAAWRHRPRGNIGVAHEPQSYRHQRVLRPGTTLSWLQIPTPRCLERAGFSRSARHSTGTGATTGTPLPGAPGRAFSSSEEPSRALGASGRNAPSADPHRHVRPCHSWLGG